MSNVIDIDIGAKASNALNRSAICDLEGAVCDLDRLAGISMAIALDMSMDPKNEEAREYVVLMANILRDKARDFKAAYYAAVYGERTSEGSPNSKG